MHHLNYFSKVSFQYSMSCSSLPKISVTWGRCNVHSKSSLYVITTSLVIRFKNLFMLACPIWALCFFCFGVFCGKDYRKVKAQYTKTVGFGHHLLLLHNVTYSSAGKIGRGRHVVCALTHTSPCKSLNMGRSSDRAADSRENARLNGVIKCNYPLNCE